MSEWLLTAYHEAGHALIARSLKRRVDSISLDRKGGHMRGEPLGPDPTDEEIERALVVVFAGKEAERYVPEVPPWRRNDDPWFSLGELNALAAPPSDDNEGRPSDEDAIEHYTKRIGPEAIERAREFAAELVDREAALGRLELLADELLWRGHLTGEDIERLLETPTWRRGAFTPLV